MRISEAEHSSIITCSGKMEASYKEGFIEFYDTVVVSDPFINIKADYVKVEYDYERQSLKSILCQGNVTIIQGVNRAIAGWTFYNADKKFIYLKEKPKFSQDGAILQAEYMQFFLNTGHLVCEPQATLVVNLLEKEKAFFNG